VLVSGERPPARAFAGAAAHRKSGTLLVFGGAHYGPGFSDLVAYDDLWAFQEGDAAWRRLVARNPGPVGRSAPLLWIDRDRLYVFGGVTAQLETLNDLWAYDLRRNRWQELSPNGAAGAPLSRHESPGSGRAIDRRLLLYGAEHFDPLAGLPSRTTRPRW